HTERMLRWFGVEVWTEASTDEGRVVVSVEGGSRLKARDLTVPGDISSAAFPVAAAALLPGSRLELEGVGLNPTRAAVLDALRGLGVALSIEDERESSNEPTGLISVRGDGGLKPLTPGANVIRGAAAAQLID